MPKANRKGFTLIEMLVVIAIIAILVAIIIPVVSNATTMAKAATDAANLRSILSVANSTLTDSSVDVAIATANMTPFNCASFPGAKAYIYYVNPGFIVAYFEYGNSFYTVESFAESAESGRPPIPATLPEGGIPHAIGGSGT